MGSSQIEKGTSLEKEKEEDSPITTEKLQNKVQKTDILNLEEKEKKEQKKVEEKNQTDKVVRKENQFDLLSNSNFRVAVAVIISLFLLYFLF